MHIDREVHEVEQRLAQRRLKVELLARATGRRAVRSLVSPMGLLGTAALGFLAVTGVVRRHHAPPQRAEKVGRVAGIAGVLASIAFAVVRAQFGSPAQMLHTLLLRLKKTPQNRI